MSRKHCTICKRLLLLIPLIFIIIEALVFQSLIKNHAKKTFEYQLGIKAELINVLAGGNYDIKILKGIAETEDRQYNTIGRLYDKNQNLISEVYLDGNHVDEVNFIETFEKELLIPFGYKTAQGEFTPPSYEDIKIRYGKVYDSKFDNYLIMLGLSEQSITKFEHEFKIYVYILLIGSFLFMYFLIGLWIHGEDRYRDLKRGK
jgi:hypothetical protein